MLVAEWMVRDPLTVVPEENLSTAAGIMAKHRIRQLPVVEGHRLVGLLTKSDLLRACPPDLNPFSVAGTEAIELAAPVRQSMTTKVITTQPEAPLEEAARQLVDRRINSMPVIASDCLVGIITGSDISRALLAALGAKGPGVRLTFEVPEAEDVFASVAALAAKHKARVFSVTTFEHEGKRLAVVRLDSERPAMVDDLWKTGHRVSSVFRFR
jgi:acetoin utilization protein AcuB